jgi:hypothetical protein
LPHSDLTGKTGNITTAVGPSGLPILMDTFVRLSKSPVVSIAKIRGCVRGVSIEFVLACDMRFASRARRWWGPHCRLAAYHRSNCIEGSTKSWLKQPTLTQHTSTSSSTP